MLKYIIDFFWIIAIVFLLGGGLYFSFNLGFPQLNIKNLFKGFKNKSEGISSIKSLSMSLAARIGVGSLSGIALAIYFGGPGTIFWIWIIGIITSINTYCETYLGCKYQCNNDGNYEGGPAYYILKGLKKRKLATIYALIVIIAYIFGFMTIQSNTISVSISDCFNINKVIIGLIITIICALSVINGLNEIVNITIKLVPIMGITYIIISSIVIINNIKLIPQILWIIIKNALNLKSFFTGFIGSFIIGIQRGIFSTESGLGTGAIATSCTKTNNKVSYGLMQIVGIYFTIFVVCTSTALIILTSKYENIIFQNINGIELTSYALNYHLGKYGTVMLLFSVLTLAYSTIVAGYYYGESNLKFLTSKKKYINILKVITIIVLFIGSIISPAILWNLVDILVAFLAIINMYSIFLFRKEIIDDYKMYKNIV
ncbi:MAG: amino acid carrier protein [bacterium]|nr:amino acid carrier protein [bacterium]